MCFYHQYRQVGACESKSSCLSKFRFLKIGGLDSKWSSLTFVFLVLFFFSTQEVCIQCHGYYHTLKQYVLEFIFIASTSCFCCLLACLYVFSFITLKLKITCGL